MQQSEGTGDPARGAGLGGVLEDQQVVAWTITSQHEGKELDGAVGGIRCRVGRCHQAAQSVDSIRHRTKGAGRVDRVDACVSRRRGCGRLGDGGLRIDERLHGKRAVFRRELLEAEVGDEVEEGIQSVGGERVDGAGDLPHGVQVVTDERDDLERAPDGVTREARGRCRVLGQTIRRGASSVGIPVADRRDHRIREGNGGLELILRQEGANSHPGCHGDENHGHPGDTPPDDSPATGALPS